MNRNIKIFRLRKKGLTLQEIGEVVKLTQERIRQILKDEGVKKKFCKTHRKNYSKKCFYCQKREEAQRIIRKVLKTRNFDSMQVFLKQDRHKEKIIFKAMLIKELVDKYRFSFSLIGRLLKRDRTSIMNLYQKKI